MSEESGDRDGTTTALRAGETSWGKLKEILADALERDDPVERAVFLERVCAGDSALLAEAQRLVSRNTDAFEAFADLATTHLRHETSDLIGRRLGAYVIERELGHGGMGAVYLARRADGQFSKEVAIKILKRGTDTEEILRRFQIEREILARLEHPNITRLLDAGTTDDGLHYFIMEYVQGAPITALAESARLTSGERVTLVLQACRALEFAHRQGVVHRDIKPGNIVIGSDGEPKLLDFGIAKLLQPADEKSAMTQPFDRRLTPKYAAPEQIAGRAADVRSDIYSLGAVLLELLTNVPAENAAEKEIVLRSDLGRVVTRAMAADPARRYQTAADFATNLAGCRGQSVARKFAFRIGAAAALAAVIALVYAMWPGQRAARPASLAVLPFRSVGTEIKDESLGLGMADAVIGRLSALKNMRVLPTSAVTHFQQDQGNAIAAGRALHVEAVLSGTLQRAENRVRVTLQLVDVRSQQLLWASTLDQTATDIFAMQDAIAENLATLFSQRLDSEKQGQAEKHITSSPEAYDAYLLGLYFWSKRTRPGLEKAVEYFTRATERDPQFARAYALAADCYYLQALSNYAPVAHAVAQSRSAAERAITLDPSVAEAHVALATVQFFDRQGEAGRRSLREALRLNPNLGIAHQRYAWALCAEGKLEEAIQEMKRAQELDPLSSTNSSALGAVLVFARQYPEALNFCARAIEVEPNNAQAQINFGWICQLTGHYEEAIKAYQKMGELDAERSGDATALIASVLSSAGRQREADELMPQILDLARHDKIELYNMSVLYTLRGEIDRAFDWLRETARNPNSSDTMLQRDPLLDPLRRDPRFAEAMAQRRIAETEK